MHDKKAVFSFSAPFFKGIVGVNRVLYRLCDLYLEMPRYGPFRIDLDLWWTFVP
jgi:hypothetical protein